MTCLALAWIDLIGPDGDPTAISVPQMVFRAGLAFVVGLALLRVGGPRVLARYSAIDVVVAIMLGSILSRVVSGSAPLVPTLAAACTLVLLQRLVVGLAWWSKRFGLVVKGGPHLLMEDGQLRSKTARRLSVSVEDIQEAVRIAGYSPQDSEIQGVWLERDGRISVIPYGHLSRGASGASRPRPE